MALSFGTALPLMVVGIVVVVGALTCMSPLAVAMISVGLVLISGACARTTHRLRVKPYQEQIALLTAQNARLAGALEQVSERVLRDGLAAQGGFEPASGGLYS